MYKKGPLLAVLFFLIFLSAFGNASTEKISISVNDSAFVTAKHEISVSQGEDFEIELLCPNASPLVEPANLTYEKSMGKYIFHTISAQNFSISYDADCVLTKYGENWQINIASDRDILETKILLPKNAVIIGFNPAASIYFESENAIAKWSNSNSVTLSYRRTEDANQGNVLFLAGIAIILVLIVLFLFFRRNKFFKSAPKKEKEANPENSESAVTQKSGSNESELMKGLNTKEKQVMECVLLNEGISQKLLLEKCGLSKASLSRTLADLKQKGFVDMVQDGYTNKVYASDLFKKP
jgi:hypothetical protein